MGWFDHGGLQKTQVLSWSQISVCQITSFLKLSFSSSPGLNQKVQRTVGNNLSKVYCYIKQFSFPCKSRLKLLLNTQDIYFLEIFIIKGLRKAAAEVKWFVERDELDIIFSHREQKTPNTLLKGDNFVGFLKYRIFSFWIEIWI